MSGSEAGAQAGAMTCPKCGHMQDTAPECKRCGVIFSKCSPEAASRTDGQPADLAAGSLSWTAAGAPSGRLVLLLFLLCILLGAAYHLHTTGEVRHEPGVLAPADPEQHVIRDLKPWKKGEHTIVPMASYKLRARVLGTERYRFDASTDLSPVDLALGWGIMSDQRVADQLEIFQGNRRFVIVPPEKPPAPLPVLLAHSANVHILPANNGVKSEVLNLRVGEIVEFTGFLVGVQENGQWTWVTSLSRTDTGDGACEVFWVNKVLVP